MIKNSLMGVALMFAITIALTAAPTLANEGCDTKIPPTAATTKATEAPGSGKTAENCESKPLPPLDSPKHEVDADPGQQQRRTAAEPGQNIVYFGAGVSRRSDDFDYLEEYDIANELGDNEKAFTLGYLRVSNESRLLGGVDISYEGTMLDGTYGSYSTSGAFSFNGLIGANIAKKGSFRADVAGLIGARQNTTDCPSSYLGYACYADMEPSRSYSLNYGGVLAFSFKKLTLGARVTGASTQGLVGIRF